MNVLRQFEGGEPLDQCWASEGTSYCGNTKVGRIGLCAEHHKAICGPSLIVATVYTGPSGAPSALSTRREGSVADS